MHAGLDHISTNLLRSAIQIGSDGMLDLSPTTIYSDSTDEFAWFSPRLTHAADGRILAPLGRGDKTIPCTGKSLQCRSCFRSFNKSFTSDRTLRNAGEFCPWRTLSVRLCVDDLRVRSIAGKETIPNLGSRSLIPI